MQREEARLQASRAKHAERVTAQGLRARTAFRTDRVERVFELGACAREGDIRPRAESGIAQNLCGDRANVRSRSPTIPDAVLGAARREPARPTHVRVHAPGVRGGWRSVASLREAEADRVARYLLRPTEREAVQAATRADARAYVRTLLLEGARGAIGACSVMPGGAVSFPHTRCLSPPVNWPPGPYNNLSQSGQRHPLRP